jgi:hypothetical protein
MSDSNSIPKPIEIPPKKIDWEDTIRRYEKG